MGDTVQLLPSPARAVARSTPTDMTARTTVVEKGRSRREWRSRFCCSDTVLAPRKSIGQRQVMTVGAGHAAYPRNHAIRPLRLREVNAQTARNHGISNQSTLMARAMTTVASPSDAIASSIINSFAQPVIADTSVGLNAVAVQNPSER